MISAIKGNSRKANKNCYISYKDFRITVLKEGLLRFEKNLEQSFHEEMTQIVLNRKFMEPNFSFSIENDWLEITFDTYKLFFNGDFKTSYIQYKGKKIKLNNDYNLGGTYETLDGMDGSVYAVDIIGNREMGLGVCSKNGVALLDDSKSVCMNEKLVFTHVNPNEIDTYLFFYPNAYLEAVKTFFELSGMPPKLPKYVFGNWWSRFYAYSQKEYLHLMDHFNKMNVPFTVATVDMDWHYSSTNDRNFFSDIEMDEKEFITEIKEDGKKIYFHPRWDEHDFGCIAWTGYSWNKKLFSDPKSFLKDLHDRNLIVTLNLHPAEGYAFYEDKYKEYALEMGINPKSKVSLDYDLNDEKKRNFYFNRILGDLEDEGVDFWWIDWQQGDKSSIQGLTPLFMSNHYFYLDKLNKNHDPVILSRFCGIGGHRYPLGFSGDTYITYDTLAYLIKTTPQASNIGFTYWSHDVGGHMHGIKSGDLFLKFIQFAVFSPINRLHSAATNLQSKEPYLYQSGYGLAVNEYLRLRHKMIPYIYSYSLRTNREGKPLMEPLYYHHPSDDKSYEFSESQYYFAEDLLIAPFFKPEDSKGISSRMVYFPEGTFYDIKSGNKYLGNRTIHITRVMEEMPCFIKEGAFFILDANHQGNSIENPDHLEVITTIGKGSYVFLEDDKEGNILETSFFVSNISDIETVFTVNITGSKTVFKTNRKYTFKVLNANQFDKINVKNAELINELVFENILEITIDSVGYNKKVEISLVRSASSAFEDVKKSLCKKILYIDGTSNARYEFERDIRNAEKMEELEGIINTSKIEKVGKGMLLEILEAAL